MGDKKVCAFCVWSEQKIKHTYICTNRDGEYGDIVDEQYSCSKFKTAIECDRCGYKTTVADIEEERADRCFEGWWDGEMLICGDCYYGLSHKDLEDQLDELMEDD